MILRLTRRAAKDIEDIADYIKAHDPAAALRVRTEIQVTLRNIAEYPEMGRRQDVEGVRKVVTQHHRFLIYYLADAVSGDFAVLTVQHPRKERPFDDI